MITVEREKLTKELEGELLPILEDHRQELSKYKDMKLNPDWRMYYELQKIDRLFIFIARNTMGSIVGYSVFFSNTNLHYSDYVYAHQDVFYVVKNKRGGVIAKKLLKYSEEVLYEVCEVIIHHVKLTNNFGAFLEKFGYNKSEIMYHKRG